MTDSLETEHQGYIEWCTARVQKNIYEQKIFVQQCQELPIVIQRHFNTRLYLLLVTITQRPSLKTRALGWLTESRWWTVRERNSTYRLERFHDSHLPHSDSTPSSHYAFSFWFNQHNQPQAHSILQPLWIKNQTRIPSAKTQIMKAYIQKTTRHTSVPRQ